MAIVGKGCKVMVGWVCVLLLQLPSSLVAQSSSGSNSSSTSIVSNAAKLNASKVNLTSGAACRSECAGLSEFEVTLSEALENPDLNQAEVCAAVQAGNKVVRCVFNWPATCIAYYTNFFKTKANCKRIGVHIDQEPPFSNYTVATCRMCSKSSGASGDRTYWDEPSLAECEAHCTKTRDCSAFDFDATRNMCRTWTSCTESVRTKRFGCQWTVYTRPGFVQPSTQLSRPWYDSGASPSIRPGPAADYWTTSSPPPRLSKQPHMIGVTSEAGPGRGRIVSWWAHILCIDAVLVLATAQLGALR